MRASPRRPSRPTRPPAPARPGRNQLSWAYVLLVLRHATPRDTRRAGGPHNPSRSATADRNEAARARRTTQHAAMRRRLTMITPSSTRGRHLLRVPRVRHGQNGVRHRSALPASHRQHDPEARLAAHHAVVGLGGPFQGVDFVHRTHAGLDAERQRVLRVDGRAGVPALDGPAAPDEQERGGLQSTRRPRGPSACRAAPARPRWRSSPGRASRWRGRPWRRPASPARRRGRRPGCRCSAPRRAAGRAAPCPCRGRCATVRKPIFAAYWTPRWPSPPRPRTATRSPGRAPLLRSALNVVTPAHISGAASGGGQLRGHPRERGRGGDHVVGVAAVERDAGDLHAGLAGEEVAAAAVVAVAAVPGVPADADALAGLPPRRDVLAHGVDHADHLVARDAREGDAGPVALLGERRRCGRCRRPGP